MLSVMKSNIALNGKINFIPVCNSFFFPLTQFTKEKQIKLSSIAVHMFVSTEARMYQVQNTVPFYDETPIGSHIKLLLTTMAIFNCS